MGTPVDTELPDTKGFCGCGHQPPAVVDAHSEALGDRTGLPLRLCGLEQDAQPPWASVWLSVLWHHGPPPSEGFWHSSEQLRAACSM